MAEKEGLVEELFRLINEQTRTLGRRLSEEESLQCKSRGERIQVLLDSIKPGGPGKGKVDAHRAKTP